MCLQNLFNISWQRLTASKKVASTVSFTVTFVILLCDPLEVTHWIFMSKPEVKGNSFSFTRHTVHTSN